MYWRDTYSREACEAFFENVLPDMQTLLVTLAPEGWERSPLVRIQHPTPERRYQEALDFYNRRPLFGNVTKSKDDKPPKRSDFQQRDEVIKPIEELRDLYGACLWDIFSDNHEVIGPDGKGYDLGSFRGSAGFIADAFNRRYTDQEKEYDYIDFYMGTIWSGARADLTPVYEWIFRRLYALDCDWIYHFPELGLVRFGKERTEAEDPSVYDPEEAVKQSIHEKEESTSEGLGASINRLNREAKEKAREHPPPLIVQAYTNIYGAWPQGWPPTQP